jgi:hypothetical protein
MVQKINLIFSYESKYFHEKDLNNNYFVLFLLNKILYFHSQVKKFQNYIYFVDYRNED